MSLGEKMPIAKSIVDIRDCAQNPRSWAKKRGKVVTSPDFNTYKMNQLRSRPSMNQMNRLIDRQMGQMTVSCGNSPFSTGIAFEYHSPLSESGDCGGSEAVGKGFDYRILVVDDDPGVLQVSTLVLRDRGFEVLKATDGFEALAQLRRSLPDVIISDLRMPNMSGFELLSVVRKRFPQIAVIAVSAEFNVTTPTDLIADAFFSKGQYSPEELFAKIAELLEQFPIRPQIGKLDKAPVWVPRNESGYFVVTCTECLRSFSVPDDELSRETEVCETHCSFCDSRVRYLPNHLSDLKKPLNGHASLTLCLSIEPTNGRCDFPSR